MITEAVERKWLLEAIWWFATVLFAILIVLPIWMTGVQFEFYIYNFIYALSALTLLRYLTSFEHHPWSNSKLFKIILIFLVPILFFPVLEGLHSFIEYNDREGLQSAMMHLSTTKQNWMIKYIRVEYLTLGIATMVGILAMIIKMVRSLWRQVKYQQA